MGGFALLVWCFHLVAVDTDITVLIDYQFTTLDGRAYKSVDKQWTFTIELLQDWGTASSLFEAMWADAEKC